MYRLINNRIRCKFCGDIIQSTSVHDFVRCKCGKCSTDGGLEYAQRSFFTENPEDAYEDLSLYYDTETGKTVKAKDMKPENMPLRPIRVEIKKVEDEPETPHDILGKLSNMTPEEMKAATEKIMSDPQFHPGYSRSDRGR